MTKSVGISSWTRDPNTPETDKMPEVWCIVKDAAGVEHEVFAECPFIALKNYNDSIKG